MSKKMSSPGQQQLQARLVEFQRHQEELLDILQKACQRRPTIKSFNKQKAWWSLEFMAAAYLVREANKRKRTLAPASDRADLLDQLGSALAEARRKLDEVKQHDVRGYLLIEWCEANGNPDWTSPVIEVFESEFDKMVGGVTASLTDLEDAAVRAAQQIRQAPGRPDGTGALQHDLIIGLESTYRDITGKRGGAGPGPFARLVKEFLNALGHEMTEAAVIGALLDAKRRDEKNTIHRRWGRSLFVAGGNPPSSN
jgi:hypothetical protein